MTTKQNISWSTKTVPAVLTAFTTNEHGLTQNEVAKRIKKYGPNYLPAGKVDSLWLIFLRQFQSPLIYLLLAAAAVILAIGEVVDASIIFAVLLFNAIIGTIQEGKAQNSLLAIKKLTETSAVVLRAGQELIILDVDVVPGDIIILQEGSKVPADARLIFANTLRLDEASLTGESESVLKVDTELTGLNLPVADQSNMVFKGTYVLSGTGTAVVVATGLATEIGKIAQAIAAVNTEIPLKTNIRYLSKVIIVIVAVVSLLLVIIGLLSGEPLKELLIAVVSLSVSIIPEGLPVVLTLVLATGVLRMSKRHVLVKRLPAVEALGQTEIIAVDKTGTLTRNEMLLQRVYVDGQSFSPAGNGYEPQGQVSLNGQAVSPLHHPGLMLSGKIALLCANARLFFVPATKSWQISGDPTEAAMLVLAEKLGLPQDTLEQTAPKIFDLPFDSQRKYHAIIRYVDQQNYLTVAGAPENVLELCANVWQQDGETTLTKAKRQALEEEIKQLAAQGFRVIAFAMNSAAGQTINVDALPPLTFVGFFGMNDALRPEVKAAVEHVRAANMRVVMITGDHRLTAQAIAAQADIWRPGDLTITGEEIDRLTDADFAEQIAHATVFARVTPAHKLRIVEAYRARGEVIAMTGDGVNDAPSLVAADIGVAMGKIGTEVAKEASDIVLLDDNFASIVSAVEEGRGIYQTIKKVILYLFSTNTGEVMVIIGALLLGFPLPLIAVQIIWLNFVTDCFLDVALAMEPKEKGLMKGKFTKPKKWIVDGLMAQRMFLMALTMTIGTLYLYHDAIAFDMTRAWTISLTTLAAFQWFNAWNCRSASKSIFQLNPFSNKFLVGATVIVILLQLAALYLPFLQNILHTTPLSLADWALVLLVAASIIVVEEIRKFFYRHQFAKFL